jgi:hypothetical protein
MRSLVRVVLVAGAVIAASFAFATPARAVGPLICPSEFAQVGNADTNCVDGVLLPPTENPKNPF